MARRRHRYRTAELKKIAAERIDRLFELADDVFNERPILSHRYVRAAWKLKTKYNMRFPKELRLKFCRKCLSFLKPGISCRVRVQSGHVVTTCLHCGRITRLPYEANRKDKGGMGKALIPSAPKN